MNTVARIYAMGVIQLVGTDASVLMEVVSAAGIAVGVAFRVSTAASTFNLPFQEVVTDFKVLGPGCTLRATTMSGGADSSFAVRIYAARAPLGTVFTP